MAGGRYPGSRVIPPRLPVEAMLPSGSRPSRDGSGATNTPGHSGGTAPDSHRLPFHRPLAGSLLTGASEGSPCPTLRRCSRSPPSSLPAPAAGVFAARRRSDATAIADRMLWVSLWVDPPARHLLQLRAVRAVGRGRRGARVRVPGTERRAGRRVGARARAAAPRGTHARRLHVRGVPREHGLPGPAVHRRAARSRRAAGGDHLRPARVHAVAAGGRVLDRRGALAATTPRAGCARSSPAIPRCSRWSLGLLAPDSLAPGWAVDASNVLVVALAPLGFFALGVYATAGAGDGIRFPPSLTRAGRGGGGREADRPGRRWSPAARP